MRVRSRPPRFREVRRERHTGDDFPPINDYAIIGNSRTAALISKAGAIEWLCMPRFESPSLFAAILDRQKGGHFSIRPHAPFESTRRYIDETAVLETTFKTSRGTLRVTDFMPVRSEEDKRRTLWPEHEVLRIVECLSGEVECEVIFAPRPDYGREEARLVRRGALGLFLYYREGICNLRSEIPLEIASDGARAGATCWLRAGERHGLSLSFNQEDPAVLAPLGEDVFQQLHLTVRWWRQWAGLCSVTERYRDAVVRSAITLKLLTYAPSGAAIAAPTTSLPEEIGGERNWDYRYCWLRDASLTVEALLDLGYPEEANAFFSWIIHATQLTAPEVHVLYDVNGKTRLPEMSLDHFSGYRGSKPVRIGNQAAGQFQLDTYGEVINAGFVFARKNGGIDRGSARRLVELGHVICARWQEPDDGIWEARSGPRQHTYSKAMCWVGLDRLIRLHHDGQLDAPVPKFETEMHAIRDAVERHGYSEEIGSYVSTFDGKSLDASLLLLGLVGYADPAGPRMKSTLRRVREQLGDGALLYRYRGVDDGLAGGEGAFGICSFWGVEARALAGDPDGAVADFEEILKCANDIGLLAEEVDPATGAGLGNFPQAFTHVGLINAAYTLTNDQPSTGREEQ